MNEPHISAADDFKARHPEFDLFDICVNGHIQPTVSPDGCSKCRAEIWSECSCGYPLLMRKDYKPANYFKAISNREFCPACQKLYPWARNWLLRPMENSPLSAYELDLARHYIPEYSPPPVAEQFGLNSKDLSRSWPKKLLGGSVRAQGADHPKHRNWLEYIKASSQHNFALQNAGDVIFLLRLEARRKRREELQREARWRELSGQQFEREFALLLRDRGNNVTFTGGPGDQGADLILETPNGRILVQCKAYSGKVGPQPVRDLLGSMLHHQASEAWLVAIEGFTESAYEFAYGKPIKLLLIGSFLGESKLP